MPVLLYFDFLQGNPVFIEVAASELPTKTVDEILHHEKWYTEYCTLLQSKKLAIEAWRVEKQVKT